MNSAWQLVPRCRSRKSITCSRGCAPIPIKPASACRTTGKPPFFALMLADAAKVKPEVVGYRGSAPLLTDLIGGQLPVAVDTLDTLLPQHEGGKIRILAIGGARRVPNTQRADVEKAGLDVVADGWNAFFGTGLDAPGARSRNSARSKRS